MMPIFQIMTIAIICELQEFNTSFDELSKYFFGMARMSSAVLNRIMIDFGVNLKQPITRTTRQQ